MGSSNNARFVLDRGINSYSLPLHFAEFISKYKFKSFALPPSSSIYFTCIPFKIANERKVVIR